jgi:hypothetical protein
MVSKTDFEAAVDRITAAQGDTKVQLTAIKETIVALRDQIASGGVISEADLDQILTLVSEKADEAEGIDVQAQEATKP